MTVYYVFGDTGGHHQQLLNGLVNVGLNSDTFKLPENTVIIHVGDLIHKGPDSDKVVQLVDTVMAQNPDQWVQLWGNHEMNYFYRYGAPFFWKQKLSPETLETLTSWYQERKACFAYVVPEQVCWDDLVVSARPVNVPEKQTLITHAGVTLDFWEQRLGSEKDAGKVAEHLNTMSIREVTAAGMMLNHPHVPGPVWAAVENELWASWDEDMTEGPFNQIHGHTSPYQFSSTNQEGVWFPGTTKLFKKTTRVNPTNRVVTTWVHNTVHVSVDPGFEKQVWVKSQPYLTLPSMV